MVEVQDNDVLCGRGGATNNHTGNRIFRELVSARQPAYLAARKRDKKLIAQSIVDIIRERGGRFLKRDYVDGLEDWVDIGDKKASQKTAQALREGLDVWGKARERSAEEESGAGGNVMQSTEGHAPSAAGGYGRGMQNVPMNYQMSWTGYGPGYYPSAAPEGPPPSQPPPPPQPNPNQVYHQHHPESSHYGPLPPPNSHYAQHPPPPYGQESHPNPYYPSQYNTPYNPPPWYYETQHHNPPPMPQSRHPIPREPLPPTSPHHQRSTNSVSPSSPLSPSSTFDSSAGGCSCKKSLCLKLYCQCFASSKICNSDEMKCRCVNCHNTQNHGNDINRARSVILRKNPMAFQTKFKELVSSEEERTPERQHYYRDSPQSLPQWQPHQHTPPALPLQHHASNLPQTTLVHKLGCKCRKTFCIKKYCECFHGGVRCSDSCQCVDCKNRVDSRAYEEVPRNMVRVMGGVRSERGRKRGPGCAGI